MGVIVSAGNYCSGSTWLFNVLRLLLESSGASYEAMWQRVKDENKEWHLIKTHKYIPSLAESAKYIFCTQRNNKEILHSMMKKNLDWPNLDVYTAHTAKWSAIADFVVPFNEINTRESEIIGAIGNIMGINTTPQKIINQLYSTEIPNSGRDAVTFYGWSHISNPVIREKYKTEDIRSNKNNMDAYTDWIEWLSLIENKKKKTILELGCGDGTIELCKQFEQVYSFETWADEEWFSKSMANLIEFENWDGVFHPFEHFGITNQAYPRGSETQKILKSYFDELENFVNLANIDVAFVDQGFYLRGETVNYLMSKKIPVIFAHDTKKLTHRYGWALIQPTGYYSIHIDKGCGTTFYFRLH